MSNFEKISVVGLGYIGLPTAAIIAKTGKSVVGLDVNQQTVDTINQGKIHIVEEGLEDIVREAVSGGLLKATTKPEPADAFIIAVPTPFTEDKNADLTYVESAAKTIAPVLKKGDLIVLESTSPVGTTEQMEKWIAEYRDDISLPHQAGDKADVNIAYCPERVLPGQVIHELVENDRVIGGLSSRCSQRAIEMYKIFVKGDCLKTNARTAEMAKLVENASRDVSIAFANELSLICDKLDINVWELIELANHHPRVNILQPGPGVGGHCIAVDPWFIISKTPNEAKLMETARHINDSKPTWVVKKVLEAVLSHLEANSNKSVSDTTIACFGLAFKPNIDDLRGSPAMQIALELCKSHSGEVVAVEPNINELPVDANDGLTLCSVGEAIKKADIIVLLVDHTEFKELNKDLLKGKVIVDTKGLWR